MIHRVRPRRHSARPADEAIQASHVSGQTCHPAEENMFKPGSLTLAAQAPATAHPKQRKPFHGEVRRGHGAPAGRDRDAGNANPASSGQEGAVDTRGADAPAHLQLTLIAERTLTGHACRLRYHDARLPAKRCAQNPTI